MSFGTDVLKGKDLSYRLGRLINFRCRNQELALKLQGRGFLFLRIRFLVEIAQNKSPS